MTTIPTGASTNCQSKSWSTRFDLASLASLRHAVTRTSYACGLEPQSVDSFVLAVNEIATNAVVHGGGQGHLRLFPDDDRLCCLVRDYGPGLSSGYEVAQRPPCTATGGRGLWLADQLCHLTIDSSRFGTTVEISIDKPCRCADE